MEGATPRGWTSSQGVSAAASLPHGGASARFPGGHASGCPLLGPALSLTCRSSHAALRSHADVLLLSLPSPRVLAQRHPSPLCDSTRKFGASRPGLANSLLKDQVVNILGSAGPSLVSAAFSSLLFIYSLQFFNVKCENHSQLGWPVGCGSPRPPADRPGGMWVVCASPASEVFVF